MNHTKFADWATIWVSTFTGTDRIGQGLITAPDQTVRTVHSCNSWLVTINIVNIEKAREQERLNPSKC